MKEFDRIIGYAGIKNELEQTADILRNLDVYKAAGAKTPSGMLIHGAPGLGKSLMAECLIEAAGVPTFTVRKDKADGAFVDFVKEMFEQAAASAPSIVYLDDMDKFANADSEHRNADEYVAVQSCIDSVKGSDVFVLATTNDLNYLPRSLIRSGRFDRRVDVHVPHGKEASEIIKYYLSGKRLAGDIAWDDIVMLMCDCTCADLEATLNEALLNAISKREDEVSRDSFMEAFFRTRVRNSHNDCGETTDAGVAMRKRIAVHEAGHAAIYEILAGRSISLATAFRMDDKRGGICLFCKPSGMPADRWNDLRILGGLGGMAATDLVFGTSDAGACDDLRRVTEMIGRKCDDGFIHGLPFMGIPHYQESGEGKWRFETLVHAELTTKLQKAKEVLASNRDFLDKLADAIVENEYLISSDIQAIKETCEIKCIAA